MANEWRFPSSTVSARRLAYQFGGRVGVGWQVSGSKSVSARDELAAWRTAMRKRRRIYLVKLEYCLYASTEKKAVYFLVDSMRRGANAQPDRWIELLRTDVRRPGEVGDW